MITFYRSTGERVVSPTFALLKAQPLLDKDKLGCPEYFRQLKYLSTLNEDILLLEDDIHLKNSFIHMLHLAICLTKNTRIINMAAPVSYCKMMRRSDFMWTRAVYYPRNILRKMVKMISKIDYSVDKHYDILQRQILPLEFFAVPSVATVTDIVCPSLMEVHY